MNPESIGNLQTIIMRDPDSIFQTGGELEQGSFSGRWHFSFDDYNDRDYTHFGSLRALNDDTLSPGSIWPLHPHSNIEIVTYCAAGEFRDTDENSRGSVLKKGWVQHTTVGSGIWHAKIKNGSDEPLRFIQMWFLPREANLEPAVEQMEVDKVDRTNVLLPLVSDRDDRALPIAADARVYSSFLERGQSLSCRLGTGRGLYLYLLEGGPLLIDGRELPALGAAKVIGGDELGLEAADDGELLLVDVPLAFNNRP